MLDLNPLFPSFVSGSRSNDPMSFVCRVCHRDVRMRAHVAGVLKRHFRSDCYWFRDVSYRLHMGLTVYNRLMEPMELSVSQESEFRPRPLIDLAEGYPFPEDLLPKHSRMDSKVAFMTLVSCVCDWLRSGGEYSLLRHCGAISALLWAISPPNIKWTGASQKL